MCFWSCEYKENIMSHNSSAAQRRDDVDVPNIRPRLVYDPRALGYLRQLWEKETEKDQITKSQKNIIAEAKDRGISPYVLKRALQSMKKNDSSKVYQDYEIATETYAIVNRMKELESRFEEEEEEEEGDHDDDDNDEQDEEEQEEEGHDADEDDNTNGGEQRVGQNTEHGGGGDLIQHNRNERISPVSASNGNNSSRGGRGRGRGGPATGGGRHRGRGGRPY